MGYAAAAPAYSPSMYPGANPAFPTGKGSPDTFYLTVFFSQNPVVYGAVSCHGLSFAQPRNTEVLNFCFKKLESAVLGAYLFFNFIFSSIFH